MASLAAYYHSPIHASFAKFDRIWRTFALDLTTGKPFRIVGDLANHTSLGSDTVAERIVAHFKKSSSS